MSKAMPVRADRCGLDELFQSFETGDAERARLALRRMAGVWKDRGPAGCIDGRWLRPRAGHPSITGEAREAIFAVRKETRERSRTSMKDKHVMVARCVAGKFGAVVPVPGYWMLKKAWREWLGRAAPVPAMTGRLTASRPRRFPHLRDRGRRDVTCGPGMPTRSSSWVI
jgi:hypothetical protein